MDRRTARVQHPSGRTLHLLDVENLAGGTAGGVAAVAPSLAAYRSTITVACADHVVLGTGPTFACATADGWPGARLRVGHGVDGADHALLDDVDADFTAGHYSRVVVGSGDHIFCGLVCELRSRGLVVLVVARAESVSRDLRRLAPFRPLARIEPVALAA